MIQPQPWHDDARRLRAAGSTLDEIGEAVGKSKTTLCMLFNPTYRAAQRANQLAIKNQKYRNDPEFRAARAAYWRERRAKLKTLTPEGAHP